MLKTKSMRPVFNLQTVLLNAWADAGIMAVNPLGGANAGAY
jgi:hypothetical protein